MTCPGLPDLDEIMGWAPMRRAEIKPSVANLIGAKARLRKKPVRLFTSLNLVEARAKLRSKALINATELANVRRKIRKLKEKKITSINLQAARAKLKKANAKSPAGWRDVKVPATITKSAAFDKLVTKFWTNNGKKSGTNPNGPDYFYTAWNKAKSRAIDAIKKNLARKGPAPVRVVAPPVPVRVAPVPKAPVAPLVKGKKPKERKAVVIEPKISGRAKIMGASGRMVYADLMTIADLQAYAARHKIDIKSARTKTEIIQKILSNKGK